MNSYGNIYVLLVIPQRLVAKYTLALEMEDAMQDIMAMKTCYYVRFPGLAVY